MRELNISRQIDLKEKIVYIAEECSSGAKYEYKNVDDLAKNIKFYLKEYYGKIIDKKVKKNVKTRNER